MEPTTHGIKNGPRVFVTIAVVLCLVLCGKDTGAQQPLNYRNILILYQWITYFIRVTTARLTADITNNKTYYILQWTIGSQIPLRLGKGSESFIKLNCPHQNCYVTQDRNYLSEITDFDAILFYEYHSLKMNEDQLPQARSSTQKYVFAALEAIPSRNKMCCNPHLDNFFNWTWNFMLYSDIQLPYILIYNLDGDKVGPKIDMEWPKHMKPITDKKTIAILEGKSKAAAWFVTHCITIGKRENFVQKLKTEMSKRKLTLDVYGRCSNLKCPKYKTEECFEVVKRDYYFYLSFENSFFMDYVTEKLLTALNNFAIPVVYGGADYSRFLPPGSYLNAHELGPEKLARTMKKIMQNRKRYFDFFRWRNHFRYEMGDNGTENCNICTALNRGTDNNLYLRSKFFREWCNWRQVNYSDVNKKTYYILQWTRKKSPSYIVGTGSSKFIYPKCSYENCFITDTRNYFCRTTDFDAIVFSSYDIIHMNKNNITLKRSPSQRFVFREEESAPYKMACDPVFENFFNWTWTYKLDSDIQLSHILIYNFDGDKVGPKINMEWPIYMKPIKDKQTIAILDGKSKAAAWFEKHYKTLGKREDFVHKLKPEMSKGKLFLDVYGNCSNLKFPGNKTEECYDMVKRDYYFYFCFEDSLAADYVTEILLIALDNYAIPVVYGGAEYSRFLPPGSYLNARELGPRRLARTMKKIMEDRRRFHDFFRWRNHFRYEQRDNQYEICSICTALNENKANNLKLHSRFREWWNQDYNSKCT